MAPAGTGAIAAGTAVGIADFALIQSGCLAVDVTGSAAAGPMPLGSIAAKEAYAGCLKGMPSTFTG